MDEVTGASTFGMVGAADDSSMGRSSSALARPFADAAGVRAGQTAVDVGQVAIIHPGSPWDPSEPGLDDLVERAAAFA